MFPRLLSWWNSLTPEHLTGLYCSIDIICSESFYFSQHKIRHKTGQPHFPAAGVQFHNIGRSAHCQMTSVAIWLFCYLIWLSLEISQANQNEMTMASFLLVSNLTALQSLHFLHDSQKISATNVLCWPKSSLEFFPWVL